MLADFTQSAAIARATNMAIYRTFVSSARDQQVTRPSNGPYRSRSLICFVRRMVCAATSGCACLCQGAGNFMCGRSSGFDPLGSGHRHCLLGRSVWRRHRSRICPASRRHNLAYPYFPVAIRIRAALELDFGDRRHLHCDPRLLLATARPRWLSGS